MSAKVWIDGVFYDKLDAKIGVFDHAFLFGDGVVEDLRIRGGQPFRLASHLDRLFDSAAKISLEMPIDRAGLKSIIEDAIRVNERSEGLVRVIVTRGAGSLGFDPRKCEPSVIVIAEDMMPIPRELYDHGVNLITSSITLDRSKAGTLSRVDAIRAKAEAFRGGCFDALTTGVGERIGGTIEGSIFVIEKSVVKTPPVSDAGNDVIRVDLIDLVRAEGLTLEECDVRREDVLAATETFIVGELVEVIAAVQLDGAVIGTGTQGPIVKRLREAYRLLG